jgi:hypothetical protein
MKQKGGGYNIFEKIIEFIDLLFNNPTYIVFVKFIILAVLTTLIICWYNTNIQVDISIAIVIIQFFASVYIIYNISNTIGVFVEDMKNTTYALFGSVILGFSTQIITLIIMITAMYVLIKDNKKSQKKAEESQKKSNKGSQKNANKRSKKKANKESKKKANKESKKITINEQIYIDGYKSNYVVQLFTIFLGCGFLYYLKKVSTTDNERIIKRFMKILVIVFMCFVSAKLFSDSIGFYNKCVNGLFKIPDLPPNLIQPKIQVATDNPIVWKLPPVPTSINNNNTTNKPTAKPGDICI